MKRRAFLAVGAGVALAGCTASGPPSTPDIDEEVIKTISSRSVSCGFDCTETLVVIEFTDYVSGDVIVYILDDDGDVADIVSTNMDNERIARLRSGVSGFAADSIELKLELEE